MSKIKVATVWLAGCSGCHMSFLDLDEWLFELAKYVDIVYSPFADLKEFPDNVDVTLVEGAIANEENLELAHLVRQKSKMVISFGDCAITANVPAMRNMLGKSDDQVLKRAYLELGNITPQLPNEPGIVPPLLEQVRPLHEVIDVDLFIPGCPPPAPRIKEALEALVQGKNPVMEGRQMLKFG
jgi:NAD-reducing hydrogenase small subunit